jgi:hypothetical protein
MVVTSPQCPPALRDEQVDAGVDLLDRVLLGSDQRGDRDATLLARLDHVVRRHAERVGDQLDGMAHRHVQQRAAGVPGQRRRADPRRLLGVDVVAGQ